MKLKDETGLFLGEPGKELHPLKRLTCALRLPWRSPDSVCDGWHHRQPRRALTAGRTAPSLCVIIVGWAGTRRVLTPTTTAIIVAVVVAGLAGYLVSRSQGPAQPVAPTPSSVADPNGPFSTDGYSAADDVADNQLGHVRRRSQPRSDVGLEMAANGRSAPAEESFGREEAAIAYDPQLHMVLLFGGVAPPPNRFDDTWGWDGTTWHELDTSVKRPHPGEAAMTWDPAVNAMVLVPASSPGTEYMDVVGDALGRPSATESLSAIRPGRNRLRPDAARG